MFSKSHRFTSQPPPFGMIHYLSFSEIDMKKLTESNMDRLLAKYDDLNYLWIDDRNRTLEIWANDVETIQIITKKLKTTLKHET